MSESGAHESGAHESGAHESSADESDAGRTGTGKSSTGKSSAGKSSAAKAGVSAGSSTSVIGGVREVITNLLGRPLASFHLIVALAMLLTIFGLVMVLSASSVEGYSKEGSAYGLFTTQVIFALLGLVGFYLMMRLPIRVFRRLATPAIIVTTILLALVLVPGIGTLSQGARRWFVISGLSVQPSELVKVALCIWGAHLLASRRANASLKELLLPLVPVAAFICLLIILEPNLSTTITIAIIVFALLWFAGLSMKVFAGFVAGGAAIAVGLAMIEGYRSQRVLSFLGSIDDPQGAGYQARQAMYALANGRIVGVGLGQSRAKWNYLPNAHNDFIFAIIGEELGLLGGLMVVLLFVLFTYVGFRIASRSVDPFLRLLAATITVLIVAQAFINIGYVIGLLPVTGIQLPLLSAGGTSTLTILAMLGLLANAARHEPEAVAALSTGQTTGINRLLRLPKPAAYRPERARRDRTDGRADSRRSPRVMSSDRGSGASARAGRPAESPAPRWRRLLPGRTPRAQRPQPARGTDVRGRNVAGPRGSSRVRIDYRTGYQGADPGRPSSAGGRRR